MAEGRGSKQAVILKPAMMAAIVLYIVLVIVIGVTIQLGFALTATVALLPVLLIAIAAIAGTARNSRDQERYETMGATTRISMSAAGDFESIKNQVTTNVHAGKRFHLLAETPDSLTIRVGIGPFTWGEEIHVALSPGPNGTLLEAECRHFRQPTAIVDFGQSRRDLKWLLKGVQDASRVQHP